MNDYSSLYPPAPEGIPADLAVPSRSYRLLVVVVLFSLFVFVLLYLGLVAGSAYLVYWSFTYPDDERGSNFFFQLCAIAASLMIFLFLLKGLFKTRRIDQSQYLRLCENEHPKLFAFVRQLCRDTKAPFPRRIYASPEVNAAVFYDTSLISLFWPVKKNLLIGLGLVNTLSLNEFKAVLAHEFGHFSQRSMKLGSYVYTANGIITDMVYGRDYWDNILRVWQRLDLRISFIAWGLAAVVWVLRKMLAGVFRLINLGNLALTRHMEFHADLVAVSVTGSDALVHALSKLDFANQTLMQAVRDLQDASDHQIYSADLFYHQTQAVDFLRRVRKDPKLGATPELPADPNARIQVFEAGDSPPTSMWATHPSNFERENHAKELYIRSSDDPRSPWLLFNNRASLCAEATRKVYAMWLGAENEPQLSPPEKVQEFIDEEHTEMTYDPKYHGFYDGRLIEPGDINALVNEPPQEQSVLQNKCAALYGGQLESLMERYRKRIADFDQLKGLQLGFLPMSGNEFSFRDQTHKKRDLENLIEMVDDELKQDQKWQSALDRQVFITYYQTAKHYGQGQENELADRYRFHLGVQELIKDLSAQRLMVEQLLEFLSTNPELSEADLQSVVGTLHEAHRTLDRGLAKAAGMFLPSLKNITPGRPLDQFLLEEPLVKAISPNAKQVSGEWIGAFLKQLALVQDRLGRLHGKSQGGILRLQEEIGRPWEQPAEQIEAFR